MTAEGKKDARVEIAIHHWAPRFVSAGVPLADFDEVTAAITHWDEWCAVGSKRAAEHEQTQSADWVAQQLPRAEQLEEETR